MPPTELAHEIGNLLGQYLAFQISNQIAAVLLAPFVLAAIVVVRRIKRGRSR